MFDLYSPFATLESNDNKEFTYGMQTRYGCEGKGKDDYREKGDNGERRR